MATINKRTGKMTGTICRLVGIFFIATWLLVSVTQAGAETVKSTGTNYITKMEVIPVFDVKGHIIGVYERRGVSISENGEVAAYLNRGTFDLTNGQGPVQGYSQLTFKDGSTAMFKWQADVTLSPGGKLPLVKGEGKYIKGTGRFKGIKGTVSFTGKYITPYSKETRGDLYVEATSTFTLPSQ
jgi:hypothetical protein